MKEEERSEFWRIDRFKLCLATVPNLRYFSKTIVYSSGKPVMAFTRDQAVVNKICIVERTERKRDTAGASSNDRVIGIVNVP